MRTIPTLLVSGTAVLALAGAAAAAGHLESRPNVLTIQLPDGAVAQIHYAGKVAPQVVVAPAGAAAMAPIGLPAADAPFALLDRISAQMDREMAQMSAQARALEALPLVAPGQLQRTEFANLPAGASSYSFVSTFSGGGVCSRSVEITAQGPGRQPKVVSSSSGDCGAAPKAAAPGAVSGGPAAAAHAIPVKAQTMAAADTRART